MKIHYFKDETFVEFEIRLSLNSCIYQKNVRRAYSLGALDEPVQGASLYVEKIKLASKLRVLYYTWRWSRPFSSKKFSSILMLNRSLDVERCALNRRIYNKKINRQDIFSLKVISVLSRKITTLQIFLLKTAITFKRKIFCLLIYFFIL